MVAQDGGGGGLDPADVLGQVGGGSDVGDGIVGVSKEDAALPGEAGVERGCEEGVGDDDEDGVVQGGVGGVVGELLGAVGEDVEAVGEVGRGSGDRADVFGPDVEVEGVDEGGFDRGSVGFECGWDRDDDVWCGGGGG